LKRHVLSPAAGRDVDEQFRYIAARNRDAAVRFLEAVEASCAELAGMPELGEQQADANVKLAGLRAWQVRGFENYVIFYVPIQDGIEAVRVLHAARDIAAIFEEEA
jgi:toxin ParE1/3/4